MLAQPDSDIYLAKPMQDLADFLLAEGQIESAPDNLEGLFDPQFVEAAQL